MDTITAKVGRTVRLITCIGTGIPRVVYGFILTIAPIVEEHLGENDEPTISVAYLDRPDPRKLGQVDWYGELHRHAGVRHVSHGDVLDRKVSLAWVDVLPDAAEGLEELDPINAADYFPVPEAPVLTASEKQPAPPNNIEEPRGPKNKFAQIKGVAGQHVADAAVHVDGKLVSLRNVKPGDYLNDFKFTVKATEWHEGVLYIDTNAPEPDQQVGSAKQSVDTGSNKHLDHHASELAEKQRAWDSTRKELTETPDGNIAGAPAGIAPGDAAQHPPLGDEPTGEMDAAGHPSAEDLDRHAAELQEAENARISQQQQGGTKTDAAKNGDDAPIT